MSFIKKSDVKNHLSPGSHRSNHIHMVPASIPDATGTSDTEQTSIEVAPPSFAQDYIADHVSSSAPSSPDHVFDDIAERQVPADSGRA
jgi:hypothetical protein